MDLRFGVKVIVKIRWQFSEPTIYLMDKRWEIINSTPVPRTQDALSKLIGVGLSFPIPRLVDWVPHDVVRVD
jgi:hypothetical protein|tara:strand:+ start:402 stop:617 length:216 start_codon:yes stop_codon:yes gene_type:complete